MCTIRVGMYSYSKFYSHYMIAFTINDGCSLPMFLSTPSIPEIIWVKNVSAIVVCGFLMKSLKKTYPENLKKIVGAVWELPAM